MAKKKAVVATLDQQAKIAAICANINRGKFGGEKKNAVTTLTGGHVEKTERFTSGHPAIDDAIGGGIPEGRILEIYGEESSGKSTFCLEAIAGFKQKYPEYII